METKPTIETELEAPIRGNALFDKHLKSFIKSITTAKDEALACARLSILHFEGCGDVSLCQRFFDAMPKNFVRRAAYLMWLTAYSPLKVSHLPEGRVKLSKDKSEKAQAFMTEAALKVAFWDFAPDPQDVIVTDEDAFKRFMTAISYFRRKNVTTSDAVKSLVNAVENVVTLYKGKAKVAPTLSSPSQQTEATIASPHEYNKGCGAVEAA